MAEDIDLHLVIRDLFSEEFAKAAEEAKKALDDYLEALKTSPDWEGFTGIRGIFDEWEVWDSASFTPKQFNQMWDSFSHQRKIDYVRGLIT